MGTRHITAVKVDGEIKISQYGQWDGYFTGAGAQVQAFLKHANLEDFANKVRHLGEYTDEEVGQVWKDFGADDSGWVGMDIANKVEKYRPELSRDTGAEILELVASGKVDKVSLDLEFRQDEVFCEYAYVVDLDNNTVEIECGAKPFNVYTISEFCALDMQALELISYGE